MRRRPSSRLIVLDPLGRVLLFQFAFKSGALSGRVYWATPGGAVEAGEAFEDAARRELEEETGIWVATLGPEVDRREFVLELADGEKVIADERLFLVRVADTAISDAQWTPEEREVMAAHRWWPLDALATTTEQVFPQNLADIVRKALAHP